MSHLTWHKHTTREDACGRRGKARPQAATLVLVDTDEELSSEDVETCLICCEVILEANKMLKGQEALLCEGTCQKGLHRWCVGVHKENF